MTVIGLDPGNERSALVVYDGASESVLDSVFDYNNSVMNFLTVTREYGNVRPTLVIEKVACYGMPVGESVFETVYWSGIFARAYGLSFTERITRGDVKMHLCRSMRAKDGNVRQAILDRFGGKEKAVGKKAIPGPLHGLHGHHFAALGVAITFSDLKNNSTIGIDT